MGGDTAAVWPLFGLRLNIGDVELRLPSDAELAALGEVAAAGIAPPGAVRFLEPWLGLEPPALQRRFLQREWHHRAVWRPQRWRLGFGVWAAGELAGCQEISSVDFPTTGDFWTGSWLGARFQGQGIGTVMRLAVLALGFDGLGGQSAGSSAYLDNAASRRVSEKLGYRPNGLTAEDRRGTRAVNQLFTMTREQWQAMPRPKVGIEGLGPCRELLGAR